MAEDASNIDKWLARKNVFVTGGTGFMGKVLVEKLLRSVPSLGKLYMLVRPKRGLSPEKRIEEIQKLPVGENFVADVKKVNVIGHRKNEGNKSDYKCDLIVKFLPSNPTVEKFLPVKKLFRNEMIAYNKIIPELVKFTSDGKLPVPDCIYASDNYVIMKNLCTEGYDIISHHIGFNNDQLESVLKALAKFHSASLIMSEKSPEHFSELATSIEEAVYDSNNMVLKPRQEMRADIAIKIFEELENVRNRERIYEALKKVRDDNARSTIFKERQYRVLNHGDSWSNNILVKNNEVVLIDLQVMRYTSVASDLSYFLNANAKPNVRLEHYDHFLGIYLRTLNNYLDQGGCDLRLTMDWLKEEMREFALYGIAVALLITPVFCFKKEDLNVQLFDMEVANSLEFQWNLVTPAYKENVIGNVLTYMKLFENY